MVLFSLVQHGASIYLIKLGIHSTVKPHRSLWIPHYDALNLENVWSHDVFLCMDSLLHITGNILFHVYVFCFYSNWLPYPNKRLSFVGLIWVHTRLGTYYQHARKKTNTLCNGWCRAQGGSAWLLHLMSCGPFWPYTRDTIVFQMLKTMGSKKKFWHPPCPMVHSLTIHNNHSSVAKIELWP